MRTFGASLLLQRLPGKARPAELLRRVLDEWYARVTGPGPRARTMERHLQSDVRDGQTLDRFVFAHAADSDGHWTTVVRMLEDAAQPDQAVISIEMDLEDVADRLAPLRVRVRPPGFLRRLHGECSVKTIDGFEAPPTVLQVYDSVQVDLLAQEIFAPDRKLPLVVVTDPVYEHQLVRDMSRKMAEYLFALCRVVHVSRRMTYSLTERLGKELSVFDGGVRIYWPGASRTDIGPRHPLILRTTQATWGQSPETVERELLGRLAQAIIRTAAPRFRLPPAIDTLQQRIARESLEAASTTVQELKRVLAERETQLDKATEMEQIALADNERLDTVVAGLEAELKSAREALFTERNKSMALQEALRARGGALAAPAGNAEPSTAEEAMERGRVDFAEWLALPDDIALETDLGPSVYQVLEAMAAACKAERGGAARNRALFQDLLAEHLGHPGRYEPGPTGIRREVDGEVIELRDRIHLKNTRPVETETIYFAPVGVTREQRRYFIASIGRHA